MVFDRSPAGLPDLRSYFLEILSRDFTGPVSLDSLFYFAVGTFISDGQKGSLERLDQTRGIRAHRYGEIQGRLRKPSVVDEMEVGEKRR